MISQGVVPVSSAACASFVLAAFKAIPRMNTQYPSCVGARRKHGERMKQQIAFQYEQTKEGKQRLIQRSSLVPPGQGNFYQQPQPPQSNPHRAGHFAGLHSEDDPQLYDLEEDERYYATRSNTSARRYTTTSAAQARQGGRVHHHYHEEPLIQRPLRQRQLPPQRTERDDEEEQPVKRGVRFHRLVYVGFALLIMIVGWIGFTALGQWWQGKQDDWEFGNPRTYQTDAVVGHNDSNSSPSHFIAENLRGQVIVVEYPGGDPSKGRSYQITSIPGNTGNPPVKVVFQDINHDGKLDMLVEIGDPGSVITVFLFNNGSQFVSKV